MNRKAIAQVSALSASILSVLSIGFAGGGRPNQGSQIGGPLPGLTSTELGEFLDGKLTFGEAEGPEDGVGPVFNGTSCAECHNSGAEGGAGLNLGVARVTRIGAMVRGRYSDLESVGGPVLQARSLREFFPDYIFAGEVIPRGAQFVSRRITTPLFGVGLIEAIPDSTILARTNLNLPDSIRGTANFAYDPESGKVKVGKFGWKAQHSSLLAFSADAYLNEMGITSSLFPIENKPQGRSIPAGADPVFDPEDGDGDAEKFATFMRLLAPAPRRPGPPQAMQQGERVFATLGCVNCHTPSMRTGPNAIQALAYKEVRLYSDLLVHRMGTGLADGIVQGQAKGDQFRTAPLWGLTFRRFLMHDGRARTIQDAVNAHSGEAAASASRYRRLDPRERGALEAFLLGL